MPRMDKTGPDGCGQSSGRKLGRCGQSGVNADKKGTLGTGLGLKRHSDDKDVPGKGKRRRYFENRN